MQRLGVIKLNNVGGKNELVPSLTIHSLLFTMTCPLSDSKIAGELCLGKLVEPNLLIKFFSLFVLFCVCLLPKKFSI